nr:cell wall protein DAN4 isoform X1 [Crassostrea gigas]
MKIQASVLEFSTFLIFSTFHAVRAINLKSPPKNLSDASSHFGLLIGNTFTNDSLGNAGHVIIPVFYHTKTSLPPTSKSIRTVTKTTLTTEKLTSRNPTSSNIGQQGQSEISRGPINTNSNSSLNNSDKNNSIVGSVTDHFSNINAKTTSSSKTTIKQKKNPLSYSKTVIQMTTALPETNKATGYIDDKKTEQNREQTTGTSILKTKSTTPKHTTPTPTTSQITTSKAIQIVTTTLKTTNISTSTPSTTKTPTTVVIPATKSSSTATTTQTSTKTTTTPAPTSSQTTKTTTTPAPTTPQTTKPTTSPSLTTKLRTTELRTTSSKTTIAFNQRTTNNIGSNDSAKKHNESLASTTEKTGTQTMPSLSPTNFVKISSSGVTVNKDGGNTDSTTASLSTSKSFTNNKEFTTKRYSTNIASTAKINENTFLKNSTEAERPTTAAETLSEEPSQSDGDKYWPVAMAITIGVPSIIVIGVTISVINRKRTLERAHSTLLNGYITPPVEYEV